MNLRITLLCCLLMFSLTTAQAAEPGDTHAAVHPYLTEDVVALAFVDVRAVDLEAALVLAENSGWLYPKDIQDLHRQASQVQQVLDQLKSLGLERIYAVLRMSDVQYNTPLFLAIVAEGSNPKTLRSQLQQLPGMPPLWRIEENAIIAGVDDNQVVPTLTSRTDTPRQAILDALATLGGGDAGLMIVGDADSRRVVREMMPALPPPFQAIDGKFVADELAWGGISAKLPPKLHAALEIQTKSRESAELVQDHLTKEIGMGQMMISQGAKQRPGQRFEKVAEAMGALRPRVEENRVVFSLGESPEEFASLVELVAQPVKAARKAAYRSQRMNNFKQIMLAALNYESANKTYPAQSILSEDGKPLLSWRVAILPYLEQQALYNQFRLDEPWDSEHNLKLAQTIPAPYLDPDPAIVRLLKGSSYTTYLGVAGPGTIFEGETGRRIKEVTDGTSNTVFVVEVTTDRAVPWTKPADWEVDFKKPFDGVERNDRRPFTIGGCDGHAAVYSPEDERVRKNWPKMLTIAGEEVIDW